MKSSRASRITTLIVAALVLLLALAACSGCRPEPQPPPTVTPTFPPPPTARPSPTPKPPAATPTRRPTSTASAAAPTTAPTATPKPPTATPTVTATPKPPLVVVGTPQVGWASYYAKGVFQSVMDAHREFAKYPPALPPIEAAAIVDCRFKRDGGRVYVRPVDIETGEPLAEGRELWVVDCAGDRLSAQWMEDNNIIDRGRGLRVEVYRLE